MNIKKLFPESKGSKKGLIEFLDKKGFYIVLILCIAIVGATAVFVTTYNVTPSNKDYDAEKIIPEEIGANQASNIDGKKVAQSAVNTSAVDKKQEVAKTADIAKAAGENDTKLANAQNDAKQADVQSANQNKAAAKPTDTKSANTASAQKYSIPVFGDTILEYAQDKVVYLKTLDHWATHSGMDIAAERGTAVKAVADGVVTDIKKDPRFGIMVMIDHQNGIKTVYANLASDEMVTVNQKIKQDDIIGSIGNSAAFESADQPHLHFEVLKNNLPVNPADYLAKK